MIDDEKKRIVSEPPPPTDEIDGEWGGDEEDDEEQTLVRGVPEAVTASEPAPSAAKVSGTAVAPLSEPATAAPAASKREEDEDDEDEDDEDEDEDEHDEDDEDDEDDEETEQAHALPVHGSPASAAGDWIPEWVPYAVLVLLVTISILVGLGLLGGDSAAAYEEHGEAEKPAPALAKPANPSPHP